MVRRGHSPLAADSVVTNGFRQRNREPECQIHHLTKRILLLLAQLHTETIKVGTFRSTPFSASRGDAIIRWRMERFIKSELGAKNVKFVDRPEFRLVFAQLDTEASLIGKFHLNPPSSFWGDATTKKIKNGRRRPCFSTDRFCFGTCTTRHWREHSDQDLNKSDLRSWRRCDNKSVNRKFH